MFLWCINSGAGRLFYGFPEYLVLWARLELSAMPGKLERNRGGEAMNRTKSRVLWVRISPIQAISLLIYRKFGP